MPPTPRAVSQSTPISGAQIGLVLAVGASMLAGIGGVGAIFSHELSPIRADLSEMKDDIRELRSRPSPDGIIDRIELLTRRIEILERP